ncbi:MAG TPA: ABC transporter substrate-binding protein, partial [Candidatus Hydrogenedentes bacterium]|nr:ABC transporter substrate-binding protein [Candidatus Hydrogenedentota bacterium]
VTKGGERAASSFVPPDTAGYTSANAMPYDPDQARKLLAEAGFPNGQGLPPVELLYNTSENHKLIAEAAAEMWKKELGVMVTLLNQDWKVYLSSMNALDYQMARSAWVGDVLDPINFLECFLTGGGNNRTGWSSPQYDDRIAQAQQAADAGERNRLLNEAEGILLDEAPILPVYTYTRKFLKSPALKGWEPNILGYVLYKNLSLGAS